MGEALGPEVFASDVSAILQRSPYEDVLRMIRVPVLFLVGEEDSLTPPEVARKMASQVPGSSVEVIPGAGHMTPLEAPERVAEILGDFFGKALAAT
jgi:pimeloyl-ACP methyl ester carboxylesterase